MTSKIKIAFTSCMRFKNFPLQPQWQNIEAEDPDYLFLLGDHIYMDYGIWPFSREPNGSPKNLSLDEFISVMDSKYSLQWNEPSFHRLFYKMKRKNAVFGVWDDHDFAWNNACGSDVDKRYKDASRELFHKWMDCSTNRPEIYHFIDIPNARVIFLDVRYYADKNSKATGQLLGDKQFEYLERALNHQQKYTLICSGLSLRSSLENWRKYKNDFKRFSKLVSTRSNVLFLAGDIHSNKFYPPSKKRPCYEVISSGFAVNFWGLPFEFDRRCNWGMITLDTNEVRIKLTDKRKSAEYKIDSWC